MSTPRKVPQIGRGPQSFSQRAQSPIPSPMAQSPYQPMQQFQPQPEPVYSVEQDIQDLSMEIYARLAVEHIRTRDRAIPEVLQDLARHSQAAAVAYFETLGAKDGQ